MTQTGSILVVDVATPWLRDVTNKRKLLKERIQKRKWFYSKMLLVRFQVIPPLSSTMSSTKGVSYPILENPQLKKTVCCHAIQSFWILSSYVDLACLLPPKRCVLRHLDLRDFRWTSYCTWPSVYSCIRRISQFIAQFDLMVLMPACGNSRFACKLV
jgi:hypothetical protein